MNISTKIVNLYIISFYNLIRLHVGQTAILSCCSCDDSTSYHTCALNFKLANETHRREIMPKWTKDKLEKVIEEVNENKQSSVRSIAIKYGIPPTTLYEDVRPGVSRSIGAGKPSVLTRDEEQEIVYCCQVLQELGFAVTKDNVVSIVSQYIADTERVNPFVHGMPGKKWWTLFQKRWPTLVQRKPQHLPKQRALAGNPTALWEYFTKVDNLLKKLQIVDAADLAKRMWNCDESGISTAVASSAVLAKRYIYGLISSCKILKGCGGTEDHSTTYCTSLAW